MEIVSIYLIFDYKLVQHKKKYTYMYIYSHSGKFFINNNTNKSLLIIIYNNQKLFNGTEIIDIIFDNN
jgi:hypothetical protein